MGIPVERVLRNQRIGDKSTPELYYLKPVAKSHKVYDIKKLARRIERTGALSAEDVIHVLGALVVELKETLIEGNRVHIDGLGTFYLSFNCIGTEKEKDCTVRNIKKVNIRFKADTSLRLFNDSNATTRGGDNNVEFYIQGTTTTSSSTGEDNGNDDEFVDPTT
ncbi:DNA-binding protein [Bacteroides sp. 214]|uniref:HU family DNA-binding protein n=1 Tax=Bacteroides sp. 214 TaxID=2302935 RepID=UPI0013D0C894|nr:HU family DNA-binding protein [Bacteroides sp. 214]NDW11459.1 DNA-binding protein [Bacteroides sp. 214]